jgi:hypothetical protein
MCRGKRTKTTYLIKIRYFTTKNIRFSKDFVGGNHGEMSVVLEKKVELN